MKTTDQMTKYSGENSSGRTLRSAALIAIASLAASACATTRNAEHPSTGNIYAGADRVYLDNYIRALPDRHVPPHLVAQVVVAEQTPRNEAWVLASYSGIEGARLAHKLFDKTEAEKLDGACESHVKISNDETLWDISEYCDVLLPQLMAFNPSLHSPQFVTNGQLIAIPGGGAHLTGGGIFRGASAAKFAQFYSVQPGDNLNKIAYTFGASPTEIANLNPSVNWSILPVGQKLVVPVSAGVGVAGNLYQNNVNTNANAGAAYHDDGAPYATSGSIVAPKPYQMRPVPDSLKGSELDGDDPYPSISVDERFVAPGAKVTVSGRNLPANTDIVISRGANGRTANPIGIVRTDVDGNFSEKYKVPKNSNAGGVIFEAIPANGGEKHQSERVSAKKISEDD